MFGINSGDQQQPQGGEPSMQRSYSAPAMAENVSNTDRFENIRSDVYL